MPVSTANSQVIYDALTACDVKLMSALPETWLVHLLRIANDSAARKSARWFVAGRAKKAADIRRGKRLKWQGIGLVITAVLLIISFFLNSIALAILLLLIGIAFVVAIIRTMTSLP